MDKCRLFAYKGNVYELSDIIGSVTVFDEYHHMVLGVNPDTGEVCKCFLSEFDLTLAGFLRAFIDGNCTDEYESEDCS